MPLALLLFFSVVASADFRCSWDGDRSFYGCDGMGIRNSAGRSVVSLGEIVRVNPAVLPTMPTPLGAELNLHSRPAGPQGSRSELTLIKGFPYFGTALETWNVGSLVGPNLSRLFDGTSSATAYRAYEAVPATRSGYRAGIALQAPFRASPARLRLRGGLAVGSGKIAGEKWSSVGLALDLSRFAFSLASEAHHLGSGLPPVEAYQAAMGVSFGALYFGLVESWVRSGGPQSPPSSLLSLRWADPVWAVFAAGKFYVDGAGRRRTEGSVTVHRNLGEKFSLGYLYGLFPGSHSLSVQLYL